MHIYLYSKQISLTSRYLYLSSEKAPGSILSLTKAVSNEDKMDFSFKIMSNMSDIDKIDWGKLAIRKEPYFGILGLIQLGTGILLVFDLSIQSK